MTRRLIHRVTATAVRLRAGPDRGAQTVDIMLWVAVFIAIIGIVGAIFRDDVRDFFNSLSYSIGF